MSVTETQPFSPLYCETLRNAIQVLQDCELRVWLYLVSRCDSLGVCFPGIADIADSTGLRCEDVITVLESLAAKQYVLVLRAGMRDPFTRRMLPNVYQIPPNLLYIRPELRPDAIESAQNALTDTNLNMYDSKIRRDSGIITTTRNQYHEAEPPKPEPRTTTTNQTEPQKSGLGGCAASSGVATGSETPTDESSDSVDHAEPDGDDSQDGLTPPTHQTAKPSNPTPGSAPPPPRRRQPPPGGFAGELPAGELESFAWEIKRKYGPTTIRAARSLVWTYGRDQVESAIAQYAAATATGYQVKSAMGFIISKCKSGDTTTENDDIRDFEGSGRRYVSGKYAEFINS